MMTRHCSPRSACTAKITTTDALSEELFGATTFARFDRTRADHRRTARDLHERLVAIGFGPDDAAALFGVRDLIDVRPRRAAIYEAMTLPETAAAMAARFFVLHRVQPERELRAWLGDPLFTALVEHAAIARAENGWQSLVSVTWFGGQLVLADARAYNAVWPHDPLPDYVMPPGHDSLGLLHVAPREPRRNVLDLCCGAGAQTLAAAAYGEQVVGVDRNPRALRFAAFNAAANDLDRVDFLLGDTDEPVAGQRFDAIVANPPFVPWPDDGPSVLFRGGGPRGDEVLARIFAGAVERLARPGSLAVVADYADIAELPDRLARWQGERRRTLVLLQQQHDPTAYAEMHANHLDDPAERNALIVRLLRHFAATGIRTLDFGYVLQDGERGRAHVMQTTAAARGSIAADVSAWFAHQRRFARGGIDDTAIALAPGLRLRTSFAPGDASMLGAIELSPIAVRLLERIAAGTLWPRDLTERHEVDALAQLLDGGWVRLDVAD